MRQPICCSTSLSCYLIYLHHLLYCSNLPKIASSLMQSSQVSCCSPTHHLKQNDKFHLVVKISLYWSRPSLLVAVFWTQYKLHLYSSWGHCCSCASRTPEGVSSKSRVLQPLTLLPYHTSSPHQNCWPAQGLAAANTATRLSGTSFITHLEPRPPSLKFNVYMLCWASFPAGVKVRCIRRSP